MRLFYLPAVFLVVCAQVSAQAPVLISDQIPKIGSIEFYGLRRVSEGKVRQTLGLKPGDSLPKSKGDVEERLDKISGVVESQLSAVCCEAGKTTLYVGIEERDAPHFETREQPAGDARLPDEVLDAYRSYLGAVSEAAKNGIADDNIAQGHSLMSYGPARVWQNLFLEFAKQYTKELRAVLRESADDEQRAAAVCVIGYVARKSDIVEDLQFAMKDPDSSVRNNAMRALGAIAALRSRDPDAAPKIAPTWFIEMLNSLVWTDRNKAAFALLQLTDSREESTLSYLRERAMPSLVEMARWKSLGHAFAPFVLLGRTAGIPEGEIQSAWTAGDREKLIAQAAAPKKKQK